MPTIAEIYTTDTLGEALLAEGDIAAMLRVHQSLKGVHDMSGSRAKAHRSTIRDALTFAREGLPHLAASLLYQVGPTARTHHARRRLVQVAARTLKEPVVSHFQEWLEGGR